MRRAVLVGLAAGLWVGVARADDDAAKEELKKFDGTWQAVSVERDGQALPKEEVEKIKLTVKGKHYTYQAGDRTVKGTHRLDPTKDPKQIDAERTDAADAGERLKGIYVLDADTFKVCFAEPGKDRPTEFSSKSGGGHRLIVMKRVKP